MPANNVELIAQWKKGKFSYVVKYYYDGVIDASRTYKRTALFGDVISTYIPKGKTGYKLDGDTAPLTITSNPHNNVIKVYYVRDPSQTRNVTYTVKYTRDGVEVAADTYTVTKEVWVLDPDDIEVSVDAISAANNRYSGYELRNNPFVAPATIRDGGVITVQYVGVPPPVVPPAVTPPVTPPANPTTPAGPRPAAAGPVATTAVDDATPVPDAEEPEILGARTIATPTYKRDRGEVLGTRNDNYWALLNLLLAVSTILASVVLIIAYFVGRRNDEDERRNQRQEVRRHGFVRTMSIVPAAVAVILFFMTEDWTLPMRWVDQWTVWMLLIAVVQIVVIFAARKRVHTQRLHEA